LVVEDGKYYGSWSGREKEDEGGNMQLLLLRQEQRKFMILEG
jgi:hypothetical protein